MDKDISRECDRAVADLTFLRGWLVVRRRDVDQEDKITRSSISVAIVEIAHLETIVSHLKILFSAKKE